MPTWSSEMCLVEYIPAVQNALKDLYGEWHNRRMFLEGIIAGFGT